MDYITPQEAAEKWGLSLRRVQYFCAGNRIPGAKQVGRQWLIPIHAQRPHDGRKRHTCEPCVPGPYHFPIFVYSPFYSDRASLSEDEQTLLRAQILTLQGDYLESERICTAFATGSSSVSVRFGASATNVYNNILLGQYSNVLSGMHMLEAIKAEDPEHQEDYRLIIAGLKYHFSYDAELSRGINADGLSPDALICFQCYTLELMIFSRAVESTGSLRFYGAFCRELEISRIIPALLLVRGCLAILCERAGDMPHANTNIAEACRLGYEEKLYSLLAKVSALNPSAYRKHLGKVYGNDIVAKIEELHQQNLSSWRVVFNSVRGVTMFPDFSPEENEILLLLSYGTSNKAIADIKGISEMEIASLINVLGKKLGYTTRVGLVAHAKRLFSFTDTAE